MKILKLEFENINSLRNTHSIDFSAPPFAGSSLFAITGPTGSGKSSILDVISLALFNQVPRLGKITRKEILEKGAILSRNQSAAFAKVTYECKQGIFASSWRISTNRNGNLREHEMEILDLSTGKLLDLKKSEVASKNEELIGLNYDQFNKSVVLAQGEFAKFLSARKHERGELLEKITGTGIYRQLGRMAFEKFREVNSEIQQQQQNIALIRTMLLEEAHQKEFASALEEKDKSCKPLEKEIEALKEHIKLKGDIGRQVAEITRLEGEKAVSEKALEGFEQQYGQPLKQHEKIREISEELRSWKRWLEETDGLQKERVRKKQEEEANLQEVKNCLEATASFTQMEITAENLSDKLEEFRHKVSELEKDRKEKGLAYRHLEIQLKSTLSGLDYNVKEDPASNLSLLGEMRSASEARLAGYKEQLKLELKDSEKEKQALRHKLKKLRQAQQEWGRLEQLEKDLRRTQAEAGEIDHQKKDLPKVISELKQDLETHNLRLEVLELKKKNELLTASMEAQRAKLQEGVPCHLCGSLEHPYATHLPELEDSLDTDLAALKRRLKELNHDFSSSSAKLQNLEQQLGTITASREGFMKSFTQKKAAFDTTYGALQQSAEGDWQQQCDLVEDQLLQLENWEKEQRLYQAVSAGIPLQEELQKVVTEGLVIGKQLQELYAGSDIHSDCRKLQENWLKFSAQQKNLKQQQQELSAKLEQKEQQQQLMEEQLRGEVLERGFESIAAAFQALLSDRHYQELHGKREKIQRDLRSQLTSLEVLNSQLKGFREKESPASGEALQEEQQLKLALLEALKKECEEYRRVLKNDSELRKELQDLKSAIATQEKSIARWRMLNELIGDSNGKKFNDFAQDLTLSQLLQLANVRLRSLSDRYRIDKALPEEDDGLVAIDEHMGGQRRSVKTLSGGETFILSLSMALALSDLASRNVEINSLFIDEGFGSLDPETLDQTLDTLERLQAESSKTIGIISHVESLKERIAIQIQLKRHGQGYSLLEVKGAV